MGLCPFALYDCLSYDLSHTLRTVPFARLKLGKARDAIWPGASEREVASCFLLDSILKKFEDLRTPQADDVALAKFVTANSHCESFQTIDTDKMTEIQYIILGEFKSIIHDFFFHDGEYILSPEIVSEGMGVGPGASVGVTGFSFYHKIAAGPMTGTNASLFSLYKREAAKYHLWDETEKIRFDHFGGFKQVIGSRLTFVPKSREVSRTICTEPLLNMLVQKGISSSFKRQLIRKFGIDLRTQPTKNRELARIGSLTGKFGTIDLASASDTVSLNLLRQILPSYILSWLMESRCDKVTLPDGSVRQLHMVSSMGNDFTFPLQTIIFSAVVLAVYRALDIKAVMPRHDSLGNWSVFGDDIIVRRDAYDYVVNLLERIGFFVNHDKSFNTGPFRESCGSDFWSGYNVRGIYCQSLKTKQDCYSLINRLNVWSANHSIPLPTTIGYILDESRVQNIPIPPWESDVAGIKVPEWLITTMSPLRRSERYGNSIIYSRYIAVPPDISMVNIGTALKMKQKGLKKKQLLLHNPPGILFSAIGQYFRSGKLICNDKFPQYKKRLAIAPCWDYYDPSASILTKQGWRNWLNGSVWVNLGKIHSSD
jgi:hypothetical protein